MYYGFPRPLIEFARIGRRCRNFIKIVLYNKINNSGRKEVLLQSDHKALNILSTKVSTSPTLYECGEKLQKFMRSPV